jgi:type IV pilus assembly protein PilA
MLCSLCAAENPIDGRYCQKCGALLQGQPDFGISPSGAPYVGPTETSGKAIASLVCGLIIFVFPSSIAAIILGHLALSDIRRAAGRLTGRGMATAGLVLGYAGVCFIPIVLIVAAIAIPNLLRAKIAANEASAVGNVRAIVTASVSYNLTYSNGFPPTLEAIGTEGSASCNHAGLIGSELASGRREGYVFTYVALPATYDANPPESPQAIVAGCTARGGTRFTINADPITRGTTGMRSFFADESGVIRVSETGAASATSDVLQ